MTNKQEKALLGWREWVSLPSLKIPAIKVKVDTGAKTSALHAFELESFKRKKKDFVRFWIHPLQRRKDVTLCCETPIIDKRIVKDSGGHAEERFVIETPIIIGTKQWMIELTLTSREDMLFRMLLGRSAITDGQFLVDPCRSYIQGKKPRNIYPNKRK